MKPKEIKRTNLGNRASPSKLTGCVFEFLFHFILVMGKKAWGKYTRLMHWLLSLLFFKSVLQSLNPSTKTEFHLNMENLLLHFQDKITIIFNPLNSLPFQAGIHQDYNLKFQLKNLPETNSHSFPVKRKLILRNSVTSFLRCSLQL